MVHRKLVPGAGYTHSAENRFGRDGESGGYRQRGKQQVGRRGGHGAMSVSVILPTLNAAGEIAALLATLMDQTQPPEEILVVDSGSTDDTAELARAHGARVMSVPRDQFDHGGTRDAALRQTAGEFVLFLTQDALPADERYIEHLLKAFADERVAAASGRQLPVRMQGPMCERCSSTATLHRAGSGERRTGRRWDTGISPFGRLLGYRRSAYKDGGRISPSATDQ